MQFWWIRILKALVELSMFFVGVVCDKYNNVNIMMKDIAGVFEHRQQ